jgi:hypothetical protein
LWLLFRPPIGGAVPGRLIFQGKIKKYWRQQLLAPDFEIED